MGQAGRTEPGLPPEERELVAEPNATLGDWRELSACEQKKERGRLRNGGLLMEMKVASAKLGLRLWIRP